MNELIIAMAVSAAALLSVSATNAAEPKAATDISAQHRHHRHHGHHHYRHHHHQYAHHRHYRPYYGYAPRYYGGGYGGPYYGGGYGYGGPSITFGFAGYRGW